MKVGEGELGYSSGLTPFVFLTTPSGSRQILVSLRPSVRVEDWTVSEDDMYAADCNQVWGYRRDVVAVRTTIENLVRSESVAYCHATEGTYYYDPESTDAVPSLFVHLTGGLDPEDTVVIAQLGFYYSNEAFDHPTLGADLLEGNGSFE